MKDIHDQQTLDFQKWEPSFALYYAETTRYLLELNMDRARARQIACYLREKPYIAQALRRS